MPDRLHYNEGLEKHHKVLVEEVTSHYCTWLNSFNTESWAYDYTPAHFLNPRRNEYADVLLEILREGEGVSGIFALTMFDGDDGGPATLYVHAERDWHYARLGKDFEANDYTVIYEDTYTVSFILQEFDTLFSPVMDVSSQGKVHLYTYKKEY